MKSLPNITKGKKDEKKKKRIKESAIFLKIP